MGTIYSRAQKVIIWLGPTDVDIFHAVEYLQGAIMYARPHLRRLEILKYIEVSRVSVFYRGSDESRLSKKLPLSVTSSSISRTNKYHGNRSTRCSRNIARTYICSEFRVTTKFGM
jgi:hypothetical protein